MADIKSNQVQLGCGTLIIIPSIVIVFSGGSKIDELKGSVDQLTKQLTVLQEKVDALSEAIKKSQN